MNCAVLHMQSGERQGDYFKCEISKGQVRDKSDFFKLNNPNILGFISVFHFVTEPKSLGTLIPLFQAITILCNAPIMTIIGIVPHSL